MTVEASEGAEEQEMRSRVGKKWERKERREARVVEAREGFEGRDCVRRSRLALGACASEERERERTLTTPTTPPAAPTPVPVMHRSAVSPCSVTSCSEEIPTTTKSAAAAASRMGKREDEAEAGGRSRKRRDWLWNLTTLSRAEDQQQLLPAPPREGKDSLSDSNGSLSYALDPNRLEKLLDNSESVHVVRERNDGDNPADPVGSLATEELSHLLELVLLLGLHLPGVVTAVVPTVGS